MIRDVVVPANKNLVGLSVQVQEGNGNIVIGNSVTIAAKRRIPWNQYESARVAIYTPVVNVGFS